MPSILDAGAIAQAEDAGRVQPEDAAAPAEEDAGLPPSTPQPVDIGLAVQYHPLNSQPRDNVISPALRILNRSASETIQLCLLTLRYYFTNEHADQCPQGCKIDGFYNGLQPSGTSTPAMRSYHATPGSAAAYLEVTFPCTNTYLEQAESVEVQQQFHTEPYSSFDELNDYSFRALPAAFADWDRVTLHYRGTLVWGTPPS